MMNDMFLIGYYDQKEDKKYRKSYECAAWYKEIEVKKGRYPIYSTGYKYIEKDSKYSGKIKDTSIVIKFEGIVTDDYFGSQFCGNAIGGYEPKHIGEKETYTSTPYAHSLARWILEGVADVVLNEEFEAREINFVYDGEPCVTYGIFKLN